MQTKSRLALCIINVLTTIAIIIGCIYEKQQYKTTIHRLNETKHKQNETILKSSETKRQINELKQMVENQIKIEIETDKEGNSGQAIEPISLGEFKLTGYCSCEICCNGYAYNRPVDENGDEIVYGAIGEELKEGYSIAVDPDVIPYRSEVVIDGKVYKAQDCGGAIDGNEIDVYFEDHDDALEFGVQYKEVFVNM